MAQVEKSIIVNTTPDKIWERVRNPNDWHNWFEGASTPKLANGAGDVGTHVELTLTVAKLPLVSLLDVTEITPCVQWRGEFQSPGLAKGYMQWQYLDMGRRTKLTFHIEAELAGAAKLAEGMVTQSFEEMADKTLLNIKAMVEG